MTDTAGALIVLEGTTGTSIEPLVEKLQAHLEANGLDVVYIPFPRAHENSSFFIQRYKEGAYGSLDSVSPYTAALFYALDRYNSINYINASLAAGKTVLTTGFTPATMAQEGAKFTNAEQRRGFFIWVDNLETQLLGIPRPSQTIVLTNSLLASEGDSTELTVFLDMCTLFPKDFQRLEVSRDSMPLSETIIFDQVWNKIEPNLPSSTAREIVPEHYVELLPPPISRERTYFIPPELSGSILSTYCETLDTIIDSHEKIRIKLAEYLESLKISDQSVNGEKIADLVLPAAHIKTRSLVPAHDAASPNTYDESMGNAAILTDFNPKNELMLADWIQKSKGGRTSAKSFNYLKRKELIAEFLASAKAKNSSMSKDVVYSFNLQNSLSQIFELASLGILPALTIEPLTPRYGFEVPDILEETGLADIFEGCFDASFALYSLLQQHKLYDIAQYTVLLGHRSKANAAVTLADILKLKTAVKSELFEEMMKIIAEKHPLLFELSYKTR